MKILIALLLLALAGCTGAERPDRVNPAPGSSTQSVSKVPKVADLRLSEARDLLRARGYRVAEEDATGQKRPVLDPSNWVVVAQSPEADAEVAGGSQVV